MLHPLGRKLADTLEKREISQREAYTAAVSSSQSKINALQNQINPHFLYNTLECIRSEAILQDCESIARMSHALASFFRYSISRKENIVTLRDELSNIKNYFFIQQFRFEDRFFLDIQVEDGDDELLDCLLPKMTLQPIVENCVFHGLEPKAEQGHVTIRISGTKDMMKIIVEDDGVGMSPDVLDKMRAALEEERQPTNQPDTHGNGIAMYNVNQRIKLAFGRDYGLFVYSTENLGTDVEICGQGSASVYRAVKTADASCWQKCLTAKVCLYPARRGSAGRESRIFIRKNWSAAAYFIWETTPPLWTAWI